MGKNKNVSDRDCPFCAVGFCGALRAGKMRHWRIRMGRWRAADVWNGRRCCGISLQEKEYRYGEVISLDIKCDTNISFKTDISARLSKHRLQEAGKRKTAFRELDKVCGG